MKVFIVIFIRDVVFIFFVFVFICFRINIHSIERDIVVAASLFFSLLLCAVVLTFIERSRENKFPKKKGERASERAAQ